MKAAHEQKEHVLQQAFEQGIFTKKEYDENYKDKFYDDYGSDSFIQYINAVMNAKVDAFLTENERILGVRKSLENQFKLKMVPPTELLKKIK